MAEKEKQAKAPAKPRKTAATKATTAKAAAKTKPAEDGAAKLQAAENGAAKAQPAAETRNNGVAHEDIARLAHRYWAERGYQHGDHESDWLRAERELRGKAS